MYSIGHVNIAASARIEYEPEWLSIESMHQHVTHERRQTFYWFHPNFVVSSPVPSDPVFDSHWSEHFYARARLSHLVLSQYDFGSIWDWENVMFRERLTKDFCIRTGISK